MDLKDIEHILACMVIAKCQWENDVKTVKGNERLATEFRRYIRDSNRIMALLEDTDSMTLNAHVD